MIRLSKIIPDLPVSLSSVLYKPQCSYSNPNASGTSRASTILAYHFPRITVDPQSLPFPLPKTAVKLPNYVLVRLLTVLVG